MTAFEKAKGFCQDFFGTHEVVHGGEDFVTTLANLLKSVEEDAIEAARQLQFKFPSETI